MITLLKGDCLEIMKGLSDKSISCFVCDLPYGCLMGGGGEEKKKRREKNGMTGVINGVDWDTKIDLTKFWIQVKRLAKDDHTPVLMFCNTRFGIDLINSNPSWFRYDLVWAKTNAVGFLQANIRPMASHEMIYVFSKKGAYYKRIDCKGDFPKNGGGRTSANFLHIGSIETIQPENEGTRCPTSVLLFGSKKARGGHPTAKPVELYEWLIARYCPEGGTVLDPTAGSFNSVFTAAKLGRNAIGIEQNTKYFWNAVSLVV